ncbi:MAG: methionine aminotransferase [Chitinophagaceae bacterium]
MGIVQVKSKLPEVGTTIFTVMNKLAAEHQAVNLGQGFPDYPMNETLVQLVKEAIQNGFNQYSHMNGLQELREVLAEKIESLYSTVVNPDTGITITPGGTYAIYTALTTVLQPGDEVIVFEPAFDSYIPNIEVNGGVPVLINLRFPEYKIDWAEVRQKLSSKTRMIMLNSPHNPTGAVLSPEDIEHLRSIVENTNIIILSDEVYEHLIFDNILHQSILRYPDLLERSFVCFSFGKVYHCTGWKLGYCVSSPDLMKEYRKVHQFNCFSCHTPSQVALSKFVQYADSYMSLGSFMQQKRDYFQKLMVQTRFTPLPSYGSYFQLYKYDRISEQSDTDFAIRLTRQAGVAAIPVSAFYKSGKDDHVVRFCFAKQDETLEKAVERLYAL